MKYNRCFYVVRISLRPWNWFIESRIHTKLLKRNNFFFLPMPLKLSVMSVQCKKGQEFWISFRRKDNAWFSTFTHFKLSTIFWVFRQKLVRLLNSLIFESSQVQRLHDYHEARLDPAEAVENCLERLAALLWEKSQSLFRLLSISVSTAYFLSCWTGRL